MAWVAPRTWVAGEVVTAAIMNAHVRDNFLALGARTTWVPTWTASTTNPVLNNGVITGRYSLAGKTCLYSIYLLSGSTTTYGSGTYIWTLPVAAFSPAEAAVGVAGYFDASTNNRYTGTAFRQATTTIVIGLNAQSMTNALPVAAANGDTWSVEGSYEAL